MIKPGRTRTARALGSLSEFGRHTGPVRILISSDSASPPDEDETERFPVVVESPSTDATAGTDDAAGSAPTTAAHPAVALAARLRSRAAAHPAVAFVSRARSRAVTHPAARQVSRLRSRVARSRWLRPARRLVAAALVVLLLLTGWSVVGALTAPGTDSVAARLAEWGRDHGFDGLITWLEKEQYRPPPTGGEPTGGIAAPAGTVLPGHGRTDRPSGPGGLPAPATMAPLANGPALPGEGVWHPVAAVHGHPAVEVAALRPDPDHTSFVAGLMWLDPTFVRGQLHPGFTDPGGTWKAPDHITSALQGQVVAAFNAGFRLNASRGGYYSEGRTVLALRDGAASLVLNRDGTAQVGAWNTDVRMGPQVASVRQNLVLLVNHGQVNPTCSSGGTAEWGSTIGQAAFIHRSAFGVTADGAEVYVGGPALSVCSLGNLLKAAGVVRGMELDINPAWVSAAYFHRNPRGAPKGFQLFPGEQVAPQHYFAPSSRDWFGWYARP